MCADTFWSAAAREEFVRACADRAGECPPSADIVAFVEQTMDIVRRPKVERHLALCRHCADEVLALEATIADETDLERGFVRRVLSMFDAWLLPGASSPVLAALHADARTLTGEEVLVGDVEVRLLPQPDGHLLGAVTRVDAPVAGAVVRLVYLREAGGDEEAAPADDRDDAWQIVRTADAVTSGSGLADLGPVEHLTPRVGEQRVEVRIDLPRS